MQTTFILATLAGSVMASHVLHAAPALKRDLEAIQARATDTPDISDISDECRTAALDLVKTIPTPGPKIQSDALKNPQTGDPCDFSTPSSLSSEYSSYSEELVSWLSGHTAEVSSAYAACSDIADLGGDALAVCSTEIPELAGSATEGADSSSKTSDSSSDDKDKDGDNSTGAAPRATGMAMAAVAAGVFAAVL
ncbi:hypothetical protein LIA77_09013 [Sarocladium implicatum]|nr:hypothetical protein LIA77_09013 [Sarocladium implicatum]